eukprot:9500060-Pyramimonas_sp.AAC.1
MVAPVEHLCAGPPVSSRPRRPRLPEQGSCQFKGKCQGGANGGGNAGEGFQCGGYQCNYNSNYTVTRAARAANEGAEVRE